MSNISQNTVTTETEIGGNGVEHSNVPSSKAGATHVASAQELTLALELSQNTIKLLKDQLEKEKSIKQNASSDSSIDKLAKILASAVQKPSDLNAATHPDNINTSADFQQKLMTVDGRSLMEAQQAVAMFKNEPKKPISIPKAFANQFGPTLAITVNGVRVAIPCDGKTYFINETHYEHARERIAKVDRMLANTDPEVVETVA